MPSRSASRSTSPIRPPVMRLIETFNDILIDTRMFLCSDPSKNERKLAFIQHPLGRLGGNYHDPVVTSATRVLLAKGYSVVQINSRGVGQSGGIGSLSCSPEARDFQLVVEDYCSKGTKPTELLFAGYSAGCLSAVMATAPSCALLVPIRRLLISYPLSVLWALTLFRSAKFETALEKTVMKGDEPVLAVFGDADQFTGIGRYEAWAKALSVKGDDGGLFQATLIKGADHFWGDYMSQLKSAVGEWLDCEQTGQASPGKAVKCWKSEAQRSVCNDDAVFVS